tara:strand:+ start:2870 stop:3127 length:258 start_codon:yes stop_codon:yes gene_type:complete
MFKYFSSLRDYQKKKIIDTVLILKNDLSLEHREYSLFTLEINPEKKKQDIDFIVKKLKYQKVFRDQERKIYLPCNIQEIIKNNHV